MLDEENQESLQFHNQQSVKSQKRKFICWKPKLWKIM